MIKKLIKQVFLYSGCWRLIRSWQRSKQGPGISILYGHRVLPDEVMANHEDPRYVSGHTSVSEVIAAIKVLRKYYTFISIDEAVSQIRNGAIEKESVVLTFDDGFKDNFLHLLPVLQEFQIPATFYINSSVIDTKESLWFQSVINYFYSIPENEIRIALSDTTYDLSTASKRYQAAFSFMQFLQREYPPTQFHAIIEQVAGDARLPSEDDYHMSWDDLKALVEEPLITIGAHSLHHYPLGYCDEALSQVEICESIESLEKKLNIKIEHFSFPRGHDTDFNDYHIQLLKEQKVVSATTTLRGINRNGQDLHTLKRIGFPQNVRSEVEEFLWYVGGIPQLLRPNAEH